MRYFFLKSLLGTAVIALSPLLITVPIGHFGHNAASADQARPNLTAIFNGNYQQVADRFGTVSRVAFDTSGRRIGVQIGRYNHDSLNGMTVEMTYLEPDATHPRGQAFDGAGKPAPLD
jgi:hypothetical protein